MALCYDLDPLPAIAPADMPLVVRQSIEADFESRKDEFHAEIQTLLGEDYVVDIDACALWPYAARNGISSGPQSSFGTILSQYIEAFITSALQMYIVRFGELGKKCFNAVVTGRKITLTRNTGGNRCSAISSSIRDGVYHILFDERWFGTSMTVPSRDEDDRNILSAIEGLQLSLNVLGGYTLVSRHSIDTHYDPVEVEAARQGISRRLRMEVVLDPNWDEVHNTLKSFGISSLKIGRYVLEYFKQLHKQLDQLQIHFRDDAITSRLQQLISTRVFKIRVLDHSPDVTFITIEKGIAYVQPGAREFGSLYGSMAGGLLELAQPEEGG
ncbi:hypothetical protein C8F01DRAFT_778260 [Mycena amicta]|nr:hypothetical protein C8F01DRAFT_778260 [Mycena amicta]